MTLCINPKCQRPENSDHTTFCQTCGSELILDGKYRVQSELGSGGFGKTYEVSSSTQASPLVLKVLTNSMEKAIELFKREAEVLAKLHHPGIPHVEADGYFVYFPRNAEEPLHCLIMEKIEGLNLQEYMVQRGNRPVNQKLVLQWFIEIVKILEMVHSHHFFHRDIKPSNVMLRTDGRLALIDFGTAREVTGTYMAKQEARGVTGIISTGYTPIEQLNGQAVQQSDFYALGRTITYLLTAKEPSDIYNPINDEFPWHSFAPNVNPDFADFLDQMMARIPKYRPPNTTSVLDSLNRINQFIQTQDPVVNPGGNQSQTPPPISSPPFPTPGSAPVSATPGYPASAPTPISGFSSNPAVPSVSQSETWSAQPLGLTGTSQVPQELGSVQGHPYDSQTTTGLKFANFGARTIAVIMDLLLLGMVSILVSFMIGIVTEDSHGEGVGYATGYALAFIIVFVLPILTWLYFACLESSSRQASLGKQLMGLQVISNRGQRIGFGKATVRFMGKLLSMIILIGYPLALFSKNNQALHDILAETFIVER